MSLGTSKLYKYLLIFIIMSIFTSCSLRNYLEEKSIQKNEKQTNTVNIKQKVVSNKLETKIIKEKTSNKIIIKKPKKEISKKPSVQTVIKKELQLRKSSELKKPNLDEFKFDL